MSRTVIISCTNVSTRLKYVTSFIFEQLGKYRIQWCKDDSAITDYFISYGPTNNKNGFQVLSDGYLETGKSLDWQINGKLPDSLNEIADGFDFFSFVFRHLSRFEEIDGPRDEHDRFISNHSWNAKHGWLHRPVVDRIIQELFLRLNEFFETNEFQIRTNYQPQLTIDVDLIFAFKRRGWLLSFGSGLKDFLYLRWHRVALRLFTVVGWRRDPYDETNWMIRRAEEHGIPIHLFYLVGGDTEYDRQGKLSEIDFSSFDDKVEIGLHPSYAASKNATMIDQERSVLESLTHRSITTSRFHYLRMQFPDSYRWLEALNFESDHSMIYVDEAGFRAGTCHEFHFYDLESERVSPMKIFPAIAMDVALKDKLSIGRQEVVTFMSDLIVECKRSQGCATILWHNSSFDHTEGWKGWREVFIRILREMGDKSF